MLNPLILPSRFKALGLREKNMLVAKHQFDQTREMVNMKEVYEFFSQEALSR